MINLAHGDDDVERHGEPRVNRAGYKVRRKNCRVPARHKCDGEIKANHAVDRKQKRRWESGEQQKRHLRALPVFCEIAPSKRKEAVDFFLPKFLGAITYRGQVRNEAEVPEQQRDGKISADSKDVPNKRTAKLGQDSHGVRIWNEPVKNPW